jgi:hypothetical protein
LRTFGFWVAAIFVLGSSCMAAASADDVKTQIQAAYDAQCKAALAKDGAGFQTSFSPTFIATEVGGKQRALPEILALVQAPPIGWSLAECSVTIRGMTVDNGTATARVTRTIRGTFTQGILIQPFAQIQDSSDTWSLAGAPLETASSATAVRAMLGNKVVDQRGTLSASPSANPKKGDL